MTVQLIPNGEQVFLDNNGLPVQFGQVFMYIPNTTTNKDTWQDVNQSALNPNPIPLDAAGRAVIWGSGLYRQIVEDNLGNQIWDQVVSAGTGQDVYWGGTSGGSANSQTMTVPGFTFTNGAVLNFVAGFSNSSALFLVINGGAPVQVFANTQSGTQPLVGGEIIAGNVVSVVADTVLGGFRLLSSSANTRNVNVLGTFARSGILSPTALAVNTNDYNPPGINNASIIRISASAPVNLTGLAAQTPSGTAFFYILDNVGANTITLLANSGSSIAANRFLMSTSLALGQNESIELHYDTVVGGWRPIPAPKTQESFRTKLTGNRTYFVRTDGNDSNDGLTNNAGGAFLTIQKGITTALSIDANGFTVTIQIGDGTYNGANTITAGVGYLGATGLVIKGNSASPANVIISTTSADCFLCTEGARATIQDMELRTTTSGDGIEARTSAYIRYGNLRFGVISGIGLLATDQGQIECFSDYSIVGGATGHFRALNGGEVTCDSRTVTLTGTPAFTIWAVAASGGLCNIPNNTYNGAATGTRISASTAGGILTNGVTQPGNAAGSTTAPGYST